MRLARLRLVAVGPFADVTLGFDESIDGHDVDGRSSSAARRDDDPPERTPRALTLIFGAGGVGKTALLAAIASTRPGHAIPPLPPAGLGGAPRGEGAIVPYVTTEWALGDDDRARPHALRVASPNAPPEGTDDEASARRREQTLFDRRAAEGGFCLVAFSGARWFSRGPAVLTAPQRTFSRYDVRAPAAFDDPTRADLARDTKQALAYPTLAAAIARAGGASTRLAALDTALREALAPVLELAGVSFTGIDPSTLEPSFVAGGRALAFDELPRGARHLTAIVALTLRALHGAYPHRDPRAAEAVALIDDLDAAQDAAAARGLPAALRASLPGVQWIATTSSQALAAACNSGELVVLRREGAHGGVVAHEGEAARLH